MIKQVSFLLKFPKRSILSAILEHNGQSSFRSSLFHSNSMNFSTTSTIEAGNASDLQEGEFKTVQVGSTPDDAIIVAKVKGKFYAAGSKCPHYGAPLPKGLLFDDQIFCPWHNASFSVIDGFVSQGPTVDGLPTYPIHENKGKLYVEVPKELVQGVRLPKTKRDPNDKRKFVILGAGCAGLSAVETLRQAGYTGEITLVSKEKNVTYDRTPLSKDIYGVDLKNLALRDNNFFDENDINLIRGAGASRLDPGSKTIEIEGGNALKYDKLLIATGGRARLPPIKGINLKNIFTVRNYEDSVAIREASRDIKNVVVIGASFIGIEAAVSIKYHFKDKVNVTVVDALSVPFERVLGPEVGGAIKKYVEKNGLKLALNAMVSSFEGTDKVEKVTLSDGTSLPADIVIVGAGIQPNTEFASKSLKVERDGGIVVNENLQTSENDIFAAGDIVWYPYKYVGHPVRIEHYSEAMNQGAIAALNMLGKSVAHRGNPFFWSWVFGLRMQYVGAGGDYDNIHVDGNIEDLDNNPSFLVYYAKGEKILSLLANGRYRATIAYDMAMRNDCVPTMSEVKSGKVTIEDLKKRIMAKTDRSPCGRAGCCKM